MCKMGNSEFTIKFYLRSQRKQREFKKNRQGQQNILYFFVNIFGQYTFIYDALHGCKRPDNGLVVV